MPPEDLERAACDLHYFGVGGSEGADAQSLRRAAVSSHFNMSGSTFRVVSQYRASE